MRIVVRELHIYIPSDGNFKCTIINSRSHYNKTDYESGWDLPFRDLIYFHNGLLCFQDTFWVASTWKRPEVSKSRGQVVKSAMRMRVCAVIHFSSVGVTGAFSSVNETSLWSEPVLSST